MVQTCDFGTITITDIDGNDIDKILIGQHLTIKAEPNPGYVFDRWWDNSSAPERNIIVDSNICSYGLTVYFAREKHTLSFYAEPPEFGRVNGLTGFNTNGYNNETITVEAAAVSTRYYFDRWDDGDTNSNRTFQFTHDWAYTALFNEAEIPTYTITTQVDPSDSGNTTGDGTYEQDTDIQIEATPDECHEFVNWTWSDYEGDHTSTDNPMDVTVTHPQTYTAHFQCIAPTDLTVDDVTDSTALVAWSYSGGCSEFIVDIDDGTSVTTEQTTETEFEFTGLESRTQYRVSVRVHCGDNDESEPISIIFETARAEYTVCGVSTDLAKGTVTQPLSGCTTGLDGTYATFTATPIAPYYFASWKDANDPNATTVSTNATFTVQITGPATYYAFFDKEPEYTARIQNDIPGAGEVYINTPGTESATGVVGTQCTLNAVPNECFKFIRWEDSFHNFVSNQNPFTLTITKNETYIAINSIREPVANVTEVDCHNATVCWEYPKCAEPFTYELVLEDRSGEDRRIIRVTPSEEQEEIEIMPENNALTAGEIVNVGDGDEKPNPIEDGKYCYTFTHLAEATDYTVTIRIIFDVMASERTVLTFTTDTCSFVIVTNESPAGYGTTSGGGNYQIGDSATLRAFSNHYDMPGASNYTIFLGWSTNGGTSAFTTNNPYHLTVTASGTYTAMFKKGNSGLYTVAKTPSNGGTVYINEPGETSMTINDGDQFIISATANSGFTFSHWDFVSLDGVDTDTIYTADNTFTALQGNYTKSGTFTAHFVNGSHVRVDVTAVASPSEGGTTTGSGSYLTGDSVTLTATPNADWVFDGWYNASGYQVATTTSYTYTQAVNNIYWEARFHELVYNRLQLFNSPSTGGTCEIENTGSMDEQLLYLTYTYVQAQPDPCYDFIGWYENDVLVWSDQQYWFYIENDRMLVATYKCKAAQNIHATIGEKDIEITWEPGGDGNCADFSLQINSNTYNIPAASIGQDGKYHYTIAGWPTSIGYNTDITITVVALCGEADTMHSDPTTTTITTPRQRFTIYTATQSSDGSDEGTAVIGLQWPNSTTNQIFSDGDTAKLIAYGVTQDESINPSRFEKWTWTEGGTTHTNAYNPMAFTVTASNTYTAVFKSAKSTSITVQTNPPNGGTAYLGSDGIVHYVNTIGLAETLYANTNSGYLFDNWTCNGNVVSSNAIFNTTYALTNKTYIANFSEDHTNDYRIRISPDPSIGGSAYLDGDPSNNDTYIPIGGSVMLCAEDTDDCWQFKYFIDINHPDDPIGEGLERPYEIDIVPDSNTDYVAVFEYVCEGVNVRVTVDDSCPDFGTVNVGDAGGAETEASIPPGTSIWIHATANEGRKFLRWYVNNDPTDILSTDEDVLITTNDNVMYTAVFE